MSCSQYSSKYFQPLQNSHIIYSVTDQTIEHCKKLCENNSSCRSANFIDQSGFAPICQLFSTLPIDGDRTLRNNGNSTFFMCN